jgi:hypothetical protein
MLNMMIDLNVWGHDQGLAKVEGHHGQQQGHGPHRPEEHVFLGVDSF